MEEIQTFLETNYLWIAIIAIVLLVTVIGYIADKKGLGKPKEKKEKNKKEIEVKQDVVKIPDVNETINNLNLPSDIINDNYVDTVANNEVSDAFESTIDEIKNNDDQKDLVTKDADENTSLSETKSNDIDENISHNISDMTSKDLQSDSLDDFESSTNSKSSDNSNKEIKTDTEELNFDDDFSNLESENKADDNTNSNEPVEVNNSLDDFDDLFKEESVPEKIEVPDAEPTQTLNIDNDFNKLLDDVDNNEETINYELPKIDSIDSSDLSDDDIWKF